MLSDPKHVLTVHMLPARLTAAEAAVLLGFAPHDIPTLVGARILTPLGRSGRTGVKYFATVELLRLRDDSSWLGRATRAVSEHWLTRNARRRRFRDSNGDAARRPNASPEPDDDVDSTRRPHPAQPAGGEAKSGTDVRPKLRERLSEAPKAQQDPT